MATLHDLPAGIIAFIAEYVKTTDLPVTPLATSSKQCQAYVEPMNFRKLVLAREGRFLALRRLTYEVEDIPFDRPGESYVSFRISEATRKDYGVTFTKAIRRLLTILKALEDQCANAGHSHPGISLLLRSSGSLHKWTYLDSPEVASDGPALTRAWLSLAEEKLPAVSVVKTLRTDEPAEHLFQMIWPQCWIALTRCLPGVRKLGLYAFDDERKALRSRDEARNAFALNLHALPSTVLDLSLTYPSYPPANQFFQPPRLTDPLGYDIFSHELGLLLKRLVHLELHNATLNLTDFFNSQTDWPDLETLDFNSVQAASTDGTWYFNMDTRMDADDYEEDPSARTLDDMRESMEEDELPAAMDVPVNPFRIAMDPEKFKEIYLAVAKAVQRMPKLRKLEITFDLQGADAGMGPGDHEFSYLHSTTESWIRESDAEIKVGWGMVPAVEIGEEVLKAWREVGEVKGATIELYLRDQDEDYYDYRLIE